MKLLNCRVCNDVVRVIHTRWKQCECGACGGQYNEDLLSATVAGDCSIFGISNLFFDEEFQAMNRDDRVKKLAEMGYPGFDPDHFIWKGEWKGDTQILRIKDPEGPRLEMDVSWVTKGERTLSKITDEREYVVGLKDGIDSVELKNPKEPSFRPQPSPVIKEECGCGGTGTLTQDSAFGDCEVQCRCQRVTPNDRYKSWTVAEFDGEWWYYDSQGNPYGGFSTEESAWEGLEDYAEDYYK